MVLFLYRFVFLFYRSLIGAHISGFALEVIICQRRISQRMRDRNADKHMTSVALPIFCHYVIMKEEICHWAVVSEIRLAGKEVVLSKHSYKM